MSSITGQDPGYAPKVGTFGMPAWVDVRNVADAHVESLALSKGMSERFTLCCGTDNFEDGLAGLRAKGEKGLGEEGERVDRSEFYSIDSSKAESLLKVEFFTIPEDGGGRLGKHEERRNCVVHYDYRARESWEETRGPAHVLVQAFDTDHPGPPHGNPDRGRNQLSLWEEIGENFSRTWTKDWNWVNDFGGLWWSSYFLV